MPRNKNNILFQLQVFMNNLSEDGEVVLDFDNFLVSISKYNCLTSTFVQILMDRIKNAGWRKNGEDSNRITDDDLTKTFKKMDLDNSGRISKRVWLAFCFYLVSKCGHLPIMQIGFLFIATNKISPCRNLRWQ